MNTTARRRGTERLEAFSDSVFAFAITLLVLNLYDPTTRGSKLLPGLLLEWPAFLALVTSFATILVGWMNHHNMFNYITRVNREFILLNGLLLFFVVLTPFVTLLVSEHLLSSDGNVAAAVYAGTAFLLALSWNVLWLYASHYHHLISEDIPEAQVKRVTRQYSLGLLFYVPAFLAAFVSAVATVVLIILTSVYFAITATGY